MTTYAVGIPIVEHFDLMDVANPYEIFRWGAMFWKASGGDLTVQLIGHERDLGVTAFNGATLKTQAAFSDFDDAQLDVIFLPGGGQAYIDNATSDTTLIEFVRRQAKQAKWIASVCTGAFVLAKADLLTELRATTHWLFLTKLQQQYPSVQVVNGYPRFVNDSKVITGGGISSGIDESLWLLSQIAGEQIGRDVELAIQYRPHPPYHTGDPSIADYDTWKSVKAILG